jgi:DNA-binding SARP family transcriptional activator
MLEFRLLGPLEVRADEGSVPIQGQRQRALLALLLLRANHVIPSETLVDLLWGERPPRTAATALQNAVSQLRKALGPSVLLTEPPGYRLSVDAAQLDVTQFEHRVALARGAEPPERVRLLREALGLWRGDSPLPDLAFEAWAEREIGRLEELRLTAVEELMNAELELGRGADLVAELEPLVVANPLRERLCGQLMLALYRSGRQTEANRAYHNLRALLVESGLEPGRPLQELFRRMLRGDALLDEQVARPEVADNVDDVLRALLAGRLVPVLGAGVNLAGLAGNGRIGVPVLDDLAAYLVQEFDVPRDRGGELTKVAQWIAVTRGVGPLYDALHEVFDRDYEPGPVHRFLAQLPSLLRARSLPQQLIVTTNYDRALERAFEQADEQLDVVSYISLGRDRGKFLHRSAEGETRVIQLPNAYADVPLDRRPVILKIHGEVDRAPDRGAESFVVSEDDYIGYLAETGIGGVLPVTLAARLRRCHFLFLGYPLLDWSLRVFLHRLWPDERAAYRSWAVQLGAGVLEREFWRRRDVELLDAPLDEYLEPIRGRLEAGAEAAA